MSAINLGICLIHSPASVELTALFPQQNRLYHPRTTDNQFRSVEDPYHEKRTMLLLPGAKEEGDPSLPSGRDNLKDVAETALTSGSWQPWEWSFSAGTFYWHAQLFAMAIQAPWDVHKSFIIPSAHQATRLLRSSRMRIEGSYRTKARTIKETLISLDTLTHLAIRQRVSAVIWGCAARISTRPRRLAEWQARNSTRDHAKSQSYSKPTPRALRWRVPKAGGPLPPPARIF